MCVALPPTHVGGCTLYVGRSTMDGRCWIFDFGEKIKLLDEVFRFWWKMSALGCFGERLGRLWDAKWSLAATIFAP